MPIAIFLGLAAAANLYLVYAIYQAAPGLGCSQRAPCGHNEEHRAPN